ncbi:LAME_0G18140g1_1 [Lachancea meyersii CBS 8951]|uniref:RING-type E3 ubiquitin transferase n=1 Tax=Lachancea meyersii CBS 8951 TaxID=1266667 RepID=A0A1G4KBR5_9SACH|nr:LAME_0G18140g1_1 [Lachancea meyersii CBS 8951]
MSEVAKPPPKRGFRRTQDRQKGRVEKIAGKEPKVTVNANSLGSQQNSESGDEDLCVVCAETIVYAAVSPCNHVVCHTCAFRQRALYDKKACLVCRTDADVVVVCGDKDASFDSVAGKNFAEVNEKYGLSFVTENAARATLNLLKFTCPYGDTGDLDFGSYAKYNAHLKTEHNKTLCMICASHKKAFPRELKIYTPNQLRVHQAKGDVKGFSGHPMCKFCSGQRFYSEDELNVHMRDKHERCHICDRIDSSNPQYFKNYDQLFEHFKAEHYVCTVQSCLDNKFVVFEDELDLQAHILKEHGNMLRTSGTNSMTNGGRRYQSRLSTFEQTNTSNTRSSGSQRASQKKNDDTDSLEMKSKRMQERARHYLNYSHTDYEQFLVINEGYKNGMITAEDLFEAYKNLFQSAEANTTLLLYDFSELFFKNSKSYKDLRAVYDREQEKQDRQVNFPSLSSSSPNLLAGNVVSGSWGRASGSAKPAARQYNFPALKKPAESSFPMLKPTPASYKKVTNAMPKAKTITATPSEQASSYKPTYLQSKKPASSFTTSLDRTMFPPLPKAKTFRAPLVNESKIPDPSQWSRNSPSSSSAPQTANGGTLNVSNGKKKGKQKQLLFHIGI